MEYSTPNLLPDTCINPQYLPFSTSFTRQDVSVVLEEGNQVDEPHYNPHSTSLAAITSDPISCLKDDEDFVGSGGTLHRCRLMFLWCILWRCCLLSESLALRTLLKLVEGGTDDDVWLWVDGDEVKIKERNVSCILESQWQEAASALSRRLKRARDGQGESVHLTERRRRVQAADSDTRFRMIAWLVISSETMRAADACRGLSRQDVWDLRGMILCWFRSTEEHFLAISDSDDVFKTFCDAMEAEGHTCHDDDDEDDEDYRQIEGLKKWISMRSLLDPSQRYDVVYLSESPWSNSSCPPCARRAQSLTSINVLDVSDNHHYQPPHHLVFLWFLWCKINEVGEFSGWLSCLDQMASHNSSSLFRVSTLKQVESWFSKLPCETRDETYLPWLNFYPVYWRHSCTFLSSHDWEQAEASIRVATLQETERHSSDGTYTLVDIRTWIGAVLWSMLTSPWSDSASSENVQDFMDVLGDYEKNLHIPALPEVEPTTAAIDVRRAIQESHHTCYKQFTLTLLDWYASAVALTTITNHAKLMPLIFLQDDPCVQCRIAEFFFGLVGEESQSSSTECQQKLHSVLHALVAITAQKGLRLEFSIGDLRLGGSSSPTKEIRAASDPNRRNEMGPSNAIHSPNRMANGPHNRHSSHTETPSNSGTMKIAGIVLEPKASRRPKGLMIKEIKLHLIKLLESIGVPILGLTTKQLPWTTLRTLLSERGWELDNWPNGVPLPGGGDQACDDNKGINGLELKHVHLLYDAMKSKTCPLGFRRIVDTATSAVAGSSRISDRSTVVGEHCTSFFSNNVILECNTPRKRLRDAHDAVNDSSHPEKRPRMSEREFFG